MLATAPAWAKLAIVLLQLEPLAFEEKPNRRYKNATPTKLYSREEVSHLLPPSHAPSVVHAMQPDMVGSVFLPHCSLKQWQLPSGVLWSRLRLNVRSGLTRNGSEHWRQRKKVSHTELQLPCFHLCRLLWH